MMTPDWRRHTMRLFVKVFVIGGTGFPAGTKTAGEDARYQLTRSTGILPVQPRLEAWAPETW
jgi:hypothetical protein